MQLILVENSKIISMYFIYRCKKAVRHLADTLIQINLQFYTPEATWGFSVLPEDTSTCGLEVPASKPPTLQSADNSFLTS